MTMTIDYREDADVDVAQLAHVFRSVGWTARADQPARLAQLLRGSMFVVSAWDGAQLVGFASARERAAHAVVILAELATNGPPLSDGFVVELCEHDASARGPARTLLEIGLQAQTCLHRFEISVA